MVSAIILGLGLLILAAVMMTPGRRRERAAGHIAIGDDSTEVLRRMGPKPTRCPKGRMDNLIERFPGGVPRTTRESSLDSMRGATRERWLYPGRGGCTAQSGDTEVGLDATGKVLWVVPVTGRVPLVYPDAV